MDDAKVPPLLTRGIRPRALRWWCVPLVLSFSAGPAFSQPGPSLSSAPSLSEPADTARSGNFQTRIEAAAQALRESNPRFKGLSPKYVQERAEFVSGNMLFVLLHEMAHVAITEMGLPVLGKMEDAADTFAALRLIRVGSDFSRRVLTDAAEGWFMADRRDRKMQDEVAYYDEHGLNQQRAYQIVCLMVGYDDKKFKDLAKETKLPQDRQDTCAGDYSNVAYSWDLVLKPHRRAPDQPRTKIDVVYGPAEGRIATARQVATSIQLLETVAGRAVDDFAWPASFTLEMQSCGSPNAGWDLSTRKLTLCYELAGDFAELYRGYGDVRADGTRLADSSERKTVGVSAFKPNRQQTRHKRKHSHAAS
jgi:Putative metallopeptidase